MTNPQNTARRIRARSLGSSGDLWREAYVASVVDIVLDEALDV